MDNPRLLTVEELKAQAEHIDTSEYNLRPGHASGALAAKWLRAQDAKTAAQVKAATLRAVGEALEKNKFTIINTNGDLAYVPVYLAEIEALRNGQMPAGWEKE